jgi:hypothetical protein
MKSPIVIKKALLKKWENGSLYTAIVSEDIFPYSVSIPKIKDSDFKNNFDETRKWLNQIEDYFEKPGITIEKQSIKFRLFGSQNIPVKVIFENSASLAKFLGKQVELSSFYELMARTKSNFPDIYNALKLSPKMLIDNIKIWNKVLVVSNFLKNNEMDGKYLRELAIPNIDTKFIESNKRLFKWIMDIVIPEELINKEHDGFSNYGFEKRYGLNYQPTRIRFRILDPSLRKEFFDMSDIEMNISEFEQLGKRELFIDNIYITENKINGLSFPDKNNSIVIFGLGYGVDTLKNSTWINSCRIHYWGDIDTHGFAILSRLRGYFPKAKSFLMDEDTLKKHESMMVIEHKKHPSESLSNLDDKELSLYKKIKQSKKESRLEQEKINFSYLQDYLR